VIYVTRPKVDIASSGLKEIRRSGRMQQINVRIVPVEGGTFPCPFIGARLPVIGM
jgi:hypothetical protein